METLPNIDINIKSGNSLINKLNFAIGSKIGQGGVELEKNTQKLINQYKKLVYCIIEIQYICHFN